MNNIFLSFLILFSPLFIFSQNTITISGYLDELETGEKLIGGTVYDLNSGKGTVTNDYGFYSLTLPIDSLRIRISYIGYATQVFEDYPENDIQINFSLKNQMLNEVVILSSKKEFIHQKTI